MSKITELINIYLNVFVKISRYATVSPDTLADFMQSGGYKLTYRTGSSISKLKHEVSRGVPVVVFVTTEPGERNYHYIAIVGYDDEKIYVSDSLIYKKILIINTIIEN